MKSFAIIIKSDYLQRTRSYVFLITLCISLAVAYTFVPAPDASYSTIRIADYIGHYNSAWFGYVTAIMTSIFLSLIGFYLVNSGIKTDVNTKVGQIVSTTSITNFKYLFSKTLSNFLILFTIVFVIFLMSILLFMLYNDGFSFNIIQFIKPYLFITLPSLFFIATLAVIFEVFFGKYSVIQNVGFFFTFIFLMMFSSVNKNQYSFDIFGSKIVTNHMENQVKEILQTNELPNLNIGYVIGNEKETKRFNFEGVKFPTAFLLSRISWVLLCVISIMVISPIFHRFNIKDLRTTKKNISSISILKSANEIVLSTLPKAQINYGFFNLLKTELLLLIRKGKRWLWVFNLIGMVLLVILPIKFSHQIALPILWFLQVNRLSDLTTKERANNVHYFAFSSYRPISRLLVSQLLSGIIFMLVLALPLILRLGISLKLTSILSILLGSLFIVLFAATLGVLSKGKKLFEVLFFMITYANINKVVFADYFGGFEHDEFYLLWLTLFVIIFGSLSFIIRKNELEK